MGTVGDLLQKDITTLALDVRVGTSELTIFLREARLREPGAEVCVREVDGVREVLISFEFGDVLLLRRGVDFNTIIAMGGTIQYCMLIPAASIRNLSAVEDYRRLVPEVEVVSRRDLQRVIEARTMPLFQRISNLRR